MVDSRSGSKSIARAPSRAYFSFRNPNRRIVGINCSTPVITKQSFKADVDRNVIIARYLKGQPLPVGLLDPIYADVSHLSTFEAAQERLLAARNAFSELPSRVRSRFSNDPVSFADFALNPANSDELVRLGLATAKPAPVKETVPAVAPTESTPARPAGSGVPASTK